MKKIWIAVYLKPIKRFQSWYWKTIQELQSDVIFTNQPGDIRDLWDKMLGRFQEFRVEDLPGSIQGHVMNSSVSLWRLIIYLNILQMVEGDCEEAAGRHEEDVGQS